MIIDHFSAVDGVKLSCIQFLVCSILSMACAAIFETIEIQSLLFAWFPILYAGIISSGVGYTLQIIGQKYTEPAIASITMSLESVFAALAGWVLLGEHLKGQEILGCVLVFTAVILTQVPDLLNVIDRSKN